jgi:hypothetical protein
MHVKPGDEQKYTGQPIHQVVHSLSVVMDTYHSWFNSRSVTFRLCQVLTHATLTVAEGNALRMFEGKIIRRIYGPVMENNIRRIRYNEEINALMKVRFIKSQRLRWLGHVEVKENDKRETVFQKNKRKTQDEMARRSRE